MVPPSIHATLTCQSLGGWVILGVLAPGSVWCSWAGKSSLPSAVVCTSQASPAVLPQPTPQPPRQQTSVSCNKPHWTPWAGTELHAFFPGSRWSPGHSCLTPRPHPDAPRLLRLYKKKSLPSSSPVVSGHEQTSLGCWLSWARSAGTTGSMPGCLGQRCAIGVEDSQLCLLVPGGDSEGWLLSDLRVTLPGHRSPKL